MYLKVIDSTEIPQLIAQNCQVAESFIQVISPLYQLPTNQLVHVQISGFEGFIDLVYSMHLVVMRAVD